jgi:hypothetical protein
MMRRGSKEEAVAQSSMPWLKEVLYVVAQRDETWLKEFCKRLGERVSQWLE